MTPQPDQPAARLLPDLSANGLDSPVRAAGSGRGLPAQPTAMLGREADLTATRDHLLGPHIRLLTLTGPGGVGKTRLAIAVAEQLQNVFADGVYFVNLAPIADPSLVLPTIAQTLQVHDVGEQPLVEHLVDVLRDCDLLLVLDNFEHLLPAAPWVADLLSATARLRVLVTSRAPLHLRWEQVLTIAPLALPPTVHGGRQWATDDRASQQELAAIAAAPSVRLFSERARAARPDFELTDANAQAVAAICAHVDGLALAIELAAARTAVLPPRAMLARLLEQPTGSALHLLTSGARDLPVRHQSLRHTIAWSYRLLEPVEQQCFRRLAVCSGGFTLDAAEAVCDRLRADSSAGEDGAESVPGPRASVLDLVASLLDKSLLRRDGDGQDEPRFQMLETIREFALEELAKSGDDELVRERHAAYFLALAERAEPHFNGAAQREWLARLESDHHNLRIALTWLRDRGDTIHLLRLGAALWQFWKLRSHQTEGRRWLESALARADARDTRVDPGPAALAQEAQARALAGAGVLALNQGDHATALARLEASVAAWRTLGNGRGLAHALLWLGWAREAAGFAPDRALGEESLALCRAAGDTWGTGESLHFLGHCALKEAGPDAARPIFEQCLGYFRRAENKWSISLALKDLGTLAFWRGDHAAVAPLYEESLALVSDVGDAWHIADTLSRMGELALAQGALERARACYVESTALARSLGNKRKVAGGLQRLGHVALRLQDGRQARSLLVESLALCRELTYDRGFALCLQTFAALAAAIGQPERAARLFGAAAAMLDRESATADLFDLSEAATGYDRDVLAVRAALGQARFDAAWAEGLGLATEQAIGYALSDDELEAQAGAQPVRPGATPVPTLHALHTGYPDGLTAREVEVLKLIAVGKSNREIAEALVLSLATVQNHLVNIYRKIDARGRTQAAAYAYRHGLAPLPALRDQP